MTNDSVPPQSKEAMSYEECLVTAAERNRKGTLRLCPVGYCSVKQQEGGWSAYKSLQAKRICVGGAKGFRGEHVTQRASSPARRARRKGGDRLRRWVEEDWRNVCEADPEGACGYKACGTGNGHEHPDRYPYCRPCKRVNEHTPRTVGEMSAALIAQMCRAKHKAECVAPGATPTHVDIADARRDDDDAVRVPHAVREEAQRALEMRAEGAGGATKTGWARAEQLASSEVVDARTLRDMRTWFARHGPDARNGGTSYGAVTETHPTRSGYCRYREDGVANPGAVAWLMWGASPAYRWLKSKEVQALLARAFPRGKRALAEVSLPCD